MVSHDLPDPGGAPRRPGGVPALSALILAALALGACGPPADRGASWRGTVDTASGDRLVVRNPPEPLIAGDEVRVSERWARPLGWDADDRRPWEPAPVVRASAGRLYVLDPVHDRVGVRTAADGRPVGSLAPDTTGGGAPFAGIHSVAVSGEVIVVADTTSIGVFGSEGGLRRRLAYDRNVIGVYGAGDGAFLVFAYGPGGAAWRFHQSPDSAPEPHRPPITRSETHPDAARSECWKVEGLSDGLMLVSCAYPVVLRFDRASEILREVAFPRPTVAPSEDQVAAVREAARARAMARRGALEEGMVERIVEREVRRHPLLKKHRAVRQDPSGGRFAVLVQSPSYMGGGAAEVLVFSPEGKHLATLSFEREWLDFDYRDGVLYAVARDRESTGPVLVSYALDLGSEAGGG